MQETQNSQVNLELKNKFGGLPCSNFKTCYKAMVVK